MALGLSLASFAADEEIIIKADDSTQLDKSVEIALTTAETHALKVDGWIKVASNGAFKLSVILEGAF